MLKIPNTQNPKKCPTQKNEKTEAGSQVLDAKKNGRPNKEIVRKIVRNNYCGVTGSRSSRKEKDRRIKGLSKNPVFYW
jgi:hypothetical protein